MRKPQAMPWAKRSVLTHPGLPIYTAPAIEPDAALRRWRRTRGPAWRARTGRDAPQIDLAKNERRTQETGGGSLLGEGSTKPPVLARREWAVSVARGLRAILRIKRRQPGAAVIWPLWAHPRTQCVIRSAIKAACCCCWRPARVCAWRRVLVLVLVLVWVN